MSREVRVLIRHVARDATDAAAIEAAYRQVSKELAVVDGMLGNELLGAVTAPGEFLVLSRWRDLEAFRTWESGARHRDSTSPLRPYRDLRGGRPFEIYEVAAAY
uniref:Putative monooxygenase n=1 Tax=Streptomyces tendae TaxID=1932 RepID=A7DWI2_STRTE|nr:putative monooxygenase [Streptomyces tendae]